VYSNILAHSSSLAEKNNRARSGEAALPRIRSSEVRGAESGKDWLVVICDLHSSNTYLGIRDENGKRVFEKKLANDPEGT
jgi:hypothetical protein